MKNMKNSFFNIKPTMLDKAILNLSPEKGLKRLQARAKYSCLETAGFITPADKTKTSMMDWNPEANTANRDIVPELEDIRAGSRDLEMQNPIALGALNRITTSSIGSGLSLEMNTDRKYLLNNKIFSSEEQLDDWEEDVETLFSGWGNSVECDASRTQTFGEIQSLSLYNTLLSGDIFHLPIMIPRAGQLFDLKIKTIESDMCSNPGDQDDTDNLIAGIKFGKHQEPIQYNFKSEGYASDSESWKKVDAYNKLGMRQVFHMFDKKRPGQTRGYSLLAPLLQPLKQITRYSEAELMAAIVSSFFTVFIENVSPYEGLTSPFTGNQDIFATTNENDYTEEQQEQNLQLSPGGVTELAEGQKASAVDTKRPNAQFDPFVTAHIKQIGMAIEVPYEELIMHFSSSYTAARAAILKAYKTYLKKRVWTAKHFCNPVLEYWMTEAVLKGYILAPGYLDNLRTKQAYLQAVWNGPAMEQVNPKAETGAAIDRIENYLSDHETESLNFHGGAKGRWKGIFTRNSRERKMIDKFEKSRGVNEEPK